MKNKWRLNRKEFMQIDRAPEGVPADPVSAHFETIFGPIAPIDTIALSAKNEIGLNRCAISGQPFHVLFTTGLHAICNRELYLILPAQPAPWPVRRFLGRPHIEESFPVDLLHAIVQNLERKNTRLRLEQGLVFSRKTPALAKLAWDGRGDGVQGLVLVDRQSLDGQPQAGDGADGDIRLLGLFPYSLANEKNLRIKNGRATEGLDALAAAPWDALCLPFNPTIFVQQQLDEGLETLDLAKTWQAIEQGADVNRPVILSHPSFGFYKAEPILKRAFDLQNEDLIRLLVKRGAQVPVDAIASLGSWGHRALIEFLMAHGADINAESVKMTAFERAEAFKNKELMAILLQLGAKKRR